MKDGCRRGRSWGLSFHHPFETGLLSPSIFYSSHNGTEIQSWQVTTWVKPWSTKHMHANLELSNILGIFSPRVQLLSILQKISWKGNETITCTVDLPEYIPCVLAWRSDKAPPIPECGRGSPRGCLDRPPPKWEGESLGFPPPAAALPTPPCCCLCCCRIAMILASWDEREHNSTVFVLMLEFF